MGTLTMLYICVGKFRSSLTNNATLLGWQLFNKVFTRTDPIVPVHPVITIFCLEKFLQN
jgi:hypothetical protein